MKMRTLSNPFTRAAAAVLALAAAAPARAGETPIDIGLAVGTAIPGELTATDSTGAAHRIDTLAGPNGLVLYFVRSVDWCPYCRAQTLSIDGARQQFASRGLSVAVVSYDSAEKQNSFSTDRKLHVTLLSDPKSEIIDAFGIRNKRHISGRFAGIPHPAAFVIRRNGEIAAKVFEIDYSVEGDGAHAHPEVAAVLAAADRARE